MSAQLPLGLRSRPALIFLGLVGALLLLGLVASIAWVWLRPTQAPPFIPTQRCIARSGETTTVISPEQAWWTSIIVGTSVKRQLPPRAASIAMATVYQETGIRNLDYGDRDSVGLFQQRPSQGWGTVEQIMDPYYSTTKFYDTLITVRNWQTGDINDVAQAVQRSGFPDAYRDHVPDARALATALTGQTPAAFSCLYRDFERDRAGLDAYLVKTLGVRAGTLEPGLAPAPGSAEPTQELVYRTGDNQTAWAVAANSVAVGRRFGTIVVRAANKIWTHSPNQVPSWTDSPTQLPVGEVRITVG